MSESKAVQLYLKMPAWAQSLLIELEGRRIIKRRYNKNFHELLAWLNESQWWPFEKLREHQNIHLRKLIEHAYNTVPYYHDVMQKRGLLPKDIQSVKDLEKLPILTKETVIAQGENMFSRPWPDKIYHSATSGSTGSSMHVPMTFHCRDLQWATWWRHRNRFGFHIGDRFVSISGKPIVSPDKDHPPFWMFSRILNQAYVSSTHLKDEYLKYYVEYLESEDFKFYSGYPSSFYILGDYLRRIGHKLSNPPEYLITGAESVLDIHKETCEEWIGAKIADQYGQGECCANCAQCPEAHNYHIDMEMCVIEKLPLENSNVDNAGWIIGTSLYNYYMPLIRYNTQDIGEFDDAPCECGRPSPVLKKIDGRVESFIITPDGRKIGRLYHCFVGVEGIRYAQIIQETLNKLTLKIVPAENFEKESSEILKRNFKAKIGRDVTIDVEMVDDIEKSKSGKFRAVISRLDKTVAKWQE